MTKKILRVSSILIDFNVVWHLKGKDKTEEPKLSLSSGPYTNLSTGYKASLPVSSARGFSKTPPRYCAVLLQRPFQLLASASAGHVHRRHPFFHPWRHLCLQPPVRPLDGGSPLQEHARGCSARARWPRSSSKAPSCGTVLKTLLQKNWCLVRFLLTSDFPAA